MLNIIPFPRKHKPKVPGQNIPMNMGITPSSAALGPADLSPIDRLYAQRLADPRFRMKVQRLGGRGERPYAVLLAEIGVRFHLTAEIDSLLDRYNGISDEALGVTNAGDFWPPLTYDVSHSLVSAS